MEIRIKKLRGQVQIVWGKNGPFDVRRGNSAMTKDLIKLEMMCRVYSFRPNPLSIILAKGLKVGNKPLVLDSVYKNVVSGFIEGYCKGVNWGPSAD